MTSSLSVFTAEGAEGLKAFPRYAPESYDGKTSTEIAIWTHNLPLSVLAEMLGLSSNGAKGREEVAPHGCTKRRIELLSSRALLNSLIGDARVLRHGSDGRPFLIPKAGTKERSGDTHISISHSANHYALALSSVPIGIDVEQWGEKALLVRSKFLTAEEQSLLFSQDFAHRLAPLSQAQRATLAWSAKEAVFKLWHDSSLTISDINLSDYNDETQTLIGRSAQGKHQALVKLCSTPAYALTIATLI